MMECAIAINTHAVTQSALNIKPPKLWAAIIKDLSLAFEWIEKDNYSEINQRQLILNLENPTMNKLFSAHTPALTTIILFFSEVKIIARKIKEEKVIYRV